MNKKINMGKVLYIVIVVQIYDIFTQMEDNEFRTSNAILWTTKQLNINTKYAKFVGKQ